MIKKIINTDSVLPAYYQLKEILRSEILSGTYAPGQKMPSEHEIMEKTGVSRATVRRAFDELDKLGMIRKERGKGTFVKQAKLDTNLVGGYFRQQVLEKGFTLEIELLNSFISKPTANDIKIFSIDADNNVFFVSRLIYVSKEPMFIETWRIPEKLCPNLLDCDLAVPFSEILEGKYNLTMLRDERYLEPSLADEFEAHNLMIKKDSPVLIVDRYSYFYSNDIPVLTCKWVVRGDRCRHLIKI